MHAPRSSLYLGFVAVVCLATSASEARPPSPWSRAQLPSNGEAHSIGGYSSGCIEGAKPLPLSGKGHRVMKPERNRHYGHPALVAFVERIAHQLQSHKEQPLGVGDLGQPRGGPAPNGHASHQSGLDVDLWFSPGVEGGEQHSVVDLAANQRSEHWSKRVPTALKLAGSSPEVARVFVNPLIKKELCEHTTGDRTWLRKLRPWYGHHEHFHVRLACPEESPECKNQGAIPKGDGCGELDWWLSAQHKKDRSKGVAKYGKRIGAKAHLPNSCLSLIQK